MLSQWQNVLKLKKKYLKYPTIYLLDILSRKKKIWDRLKKSYMASIIRGFFVYTIKKVKKSTINGHFSIWMIMSAPWNQSFSIFLNFLKVFKYFGSSYRPFFLVCLKITSQILEKTRLHCQPWESYIWRLWVSFLRIGCYFEIYFNEKDCTLNWLWLCTM